MNFTTRLAKLRDVPAIQALLEPYVMESTYGKRVTYDPVSAREYIIGYVLDGPAVLVYSGEELVGFGNITVARTFYKEPEADIEMFYVKPEHRATGAARVLSAEMKAEILRQGAVVAYTGCLSGIDARNDSLYVNLWAKQGFTRLGSVMIWSAGAQDE